MSRGRTFESIVAIRVGIKERLLGNKFSVIGDLTRVLTYQKIRPSPHVGTRAAAIFPVKVLSLLSEKLPARRILYTQGTK
jgi:hypothetical protein